MVAQAGGLDMKQNITCAINKLKAIWQFGQVSYLEHGDDVTMAQSGAIIRYLAKLGAIDGAEQTSPIRIERNAYWGNARSVHHGS